MFCGFVENFTKCLMHLVCYRFYQLSINMGLTKQYLRYVPAGNFNIVASAGCNAVFLTLEGQEGRFVGVAACEDITVWDMRLGEKVKEMRHNY